MKRGSVVDIKGTGQRIKDAIGDKDITLISRSIGVSQRAIRQWTGGKVLPSLHHLYALSWCLDTDVDSLIVKKEPI